MVREKKEVNGIPFLLFIKKIIEAGLENNHIRIGKNGTWFKIKKASVMKTNLLLRVEGNGFIDQIEILGFFVPNEKQLYKFKKIGFSSRAFFQEGRIFFKKPLDFFK